MRKKFYRQAKKAICIATLSATVLSSIPMIPYTQAYAKGQTTMEELQALSLPTENAVTYNLSDASLRTEKTFVDVYGDELTTKVIEINITKNGNYIIKGSNEINGAFVDTHIKVEKGVEANIIFDGAKVQNNQTYASSSDSCGNVYTNQLFPVLDIEGTANLYVKEDSCLTSPDTEYNYVAQVLGDLTIKEGTGRLTLMSGNYKNNLQTEEDEEVCGYAVLGSKEGENRRLGSVTVEGGDFTAYGGIVYVDKFTMTDGNVYLPYADQFNVYAENIAILGGNLSLTNDAEKAYVSSMLYCKDSLYIDGANIKAQLENSSEAIPIVSTSYGKKTINMVIQNSVISYDETQFKLEDVTDVYDNSINLFTVDGLQPNTKVKSINGQPVTGLQTADDGSLKCLLEYGNNVITLENGENYTYTYQWDEETQKESMVKNDTAVTHKVTLRDEGESRGREIIVADGFEFGKRYFDGQKYYEYEITETPQKITEDVSITLHEVKEEVTVDGTVWTDDVLPTDAFYMAEDKEEDKFIAYPGDTVQQGTSYTSFLKAFQKEGKWFVKIEKRADLDLLNENLWRDNTLNILLETDLDFSGEDSSCLLDDDSREYYGTFDGNGHGITNAKNNYYSSVLTLKNYGTIKNVHIKNASIPSNEYSADFQSGILCARNYGTIENCSVESSTVETKKRTDDDDEQSIKLRVHSALVGGNYGTIKDSFAKDITFNGDGETYPICKSFAGSKLENTYYLSEKAGEENAKTAEQFASGEVCSLLNHGVTDGSQYWRQNIGNGDERDAAPVADPSHGTVYAGYQGCVKVYSNAELQTTTPSHEVKYTAEGNTITGICKNDSSHNVQLTVSANDVTYDGKAHPATVGVECSDEWGEEEVPYKIVYTRGENPTEDLTGPGTIKASVTMGDATAEVTYTIKAAPTATPMASPSAAPTATPVVTKQPTAPTATPAVTKQPTAPTATPAVTKQPTAPTATPAVTKQPTVPTAKPIIKPTAKPTTAPTTKPTAVPTAKPTVKPTAVPTAKPTGKPTTKPTAKPTAVPSAGSTTTPAGTNPGSVPSADPSEGNKAAATQAPSSASTPAPASEQPKQPQASANPKSEPKGSKLKKNGNKYMVTSASKKTPTIKYTGSSDKTKKKVIIPKTVTIDGVEYKVTSIGKKAFRNNKSLKEVVIGKNITKIETKAFYGCKNLRKVTFQTTTLSKKSVGKNAFGKINNRASYLIPSEKLKKYKEWLKKRGAIKQQIFQKY